MLFLDCNTGDIRQCSGEIVQDLTTSYRLGWRYEELDPLPQTEESEQWELHRVFHRRAESCRCCCRLWHTSSYYSVRQYLCVLLDPWFWSNQNGCHFASKCQVLRISLRCFYWLVNTRCWSDNYAEEKSDVVYLYLLKIIQVFWLVKNCGWNRHISSVAAQICCLYNDITKTHRRHYDVIWSYIENYITLLRHTKLCRLCRKRENTII